VVYIALLIIMFLLFVSQDKLSVQRAESVMLPPEIDRFRFLIYEPGAVLLPLAQTPLGLLKHFFDGP